MTKLLQIRTAIIALYQKGEMFIKPVLKFMLFFSTIMYIRSMIGYDETYQSMSFVFIATAISSFVAGPIGLALTLAYMIVLLYPISLYMSAVVLVFSVIFLCLFYKQIRDFSYCIVAMPVLIAFKLPFLLPIILGLFVTPVAIIPTFLGVFWYYLIQDINKNVGAIEQLDVSSSPIAIITNLIDGLVKDKALSYSIIVLILIVIVVYIIRSIKMDYSFLVATVSGSLVSMIGFLLASLKCDMNMTLIEIVVYSIISSVLAGIIIYLYRPLSYHYVENVTFEDDDYLYYVRAVPKIKVSGNKIKKHVFSLEDIEEKSEEPIAKEMLADGELAENNEGGA